MIEIDDQCFLSYIWAALEFNNKCEWDFMSQQLYAQMLGWA